MHNDRAQEVEHAQAAADEVSYDSQECPSAEAGCYGNRAERTRRKPARINLRIVQGRFSPPLDLTELLAQLRMDVAALLRLETRMIQDLCTGRF